MLSNLKSLSEELRNNPTELEKFKKYPLKYLKSHGINMKDLEMSELEGGRGAHMPCVSCPCDISR